MPVVSVITTCYNKGRYVAETVETVLRQKYADLELILIDDCSTDNSVDILKVLEKKDDRIRFFAMDRNHGANHCRNLGIKEARGKYIMFLDADDLLEHDCLYNRVAEMEKSGELHFCVFSMGVFFEKPGDSKDVWHPVSRAPLMDFLRHKLAWSIVQPIWKTGFLRSIGGFDVTFERFQDIELHTRALMQEGVKFRLFPGKPDCWYRISDERRTFSPFNYNLVRIRSVHRYIAKFRPLVSRLSIRSNLLGAAYETYLQILYHYRTAQLTKPQFSELEKALMLPLRENGLGKTEQMFFRLLRLYNLSLPRIPGINFALKKVIVS